MDAALVSSGFFQVFQVAPQFGRTFSLNYRDAFRVKKIEHKWVARASAWDADVDEFVKEAPSYEPMGLPPDEPQKRDFGSGWGSFRGRFGVQDAVCVAPGFL